MGVVGVKKRRNPQSLFTPFTFTQIPHTPNKQQQQLQKA